MRHLVSRRLALVTISITDRRVDDVSRRGKEVHSSDNDSLTEKYIPFLPYYSCANGVDLAQIANLMAIFRTSIEMNNLIDRAWCL